MPDDVIESMRTGAPLKDPKLEALRTFTTKIVNSRARTDDADVDEFLAAVYATNQSLYRCLHMNNDKCLASKCWL